MSNMRVHSATQAPHEPEWKKNQTNSQHEIKVQRERQEKGKDGHDRHPLSISLRLSDNPLTTEIK